MTREDFAEIFRRSKHMGVQISLCCTSHPNAGVNSHYFNGRVRLLCCACGFEVAAVVVASGAEEKMKEALQEIVRIYNDDSLTNSAAQDRVDEVARAALDTP